ncbi:protein immune deficiency-like [Periplaneta americana]|uniref:protein immune deficiency-like n=1 Tax=Periplaneta americana TaxID=6978 RepID=UPI0037E7DFD2
MSNDKNNGTYSEDLKTDSVPDAPRDISVTEDLEENASMPLPSQAESVNERTSLKEKPVNERTSLKEEPVNEQKKTSPKSNDETYLQPPKEPSYPTKKKSPKSVPKSRENKKDKKKSPESANVVYHISHSSGIHFGPDYNVTIVQNASKTKSSQSTPKETETIRELRRSKQKVTRDHIGAVAPHVGENWRDVGRTLNLTEGRIEQIKQDFYAEGMKEVVFQMILEWVRTNASEATVQELTNSLWNCSEYSAVKKLAEWYKECAGL